MGWREEAKEGDVLLYIGGRHSGFGSSGVRLITGSRYIHCGVIIRHNGELCVLEQMSRRMIRPIISYTGDPGETLVLMRPKFPVVLHPKHITTGNLYGVVCIVDALINHLFGRLSYRWTYRPWLSRIIPGLDCSALVAHVLQLKRFTTWCNDHRVVEPDDFWNHPEDFEEIVRE